MMDDLDQGATAYPRRTERKRQTRERILTAAEQQFREVGYSRATMAEIAEAADIHVTTLFTHFKTKRDLAAAIGDKATALLEARIDAAKVHTPFFVFFRQVITEWAQAIQGDSANRMIAYGNELRGDPELAYTALLRQQREIDLFADYIAYTYRLDRTVDSRPMLVAAMLAAANISAYNRWLDSGGSADFLNEALALLDASEALVRQALEEAAAAHAVQP